MFRTWGLLLILLATTLPAASVAECTPTSTPAVVTSPATGVSLTGMGEEGVYYLPCFEEHAGQACWLYEETNLWPGLQLDDDVCSPADLIDTRVVLF